MNRSIYQSFITPKGLRFLKIFITVTGIDRQYE